jgi:ABC-2 type transport system ATP-binding protein
MNEKIIDCQQVCKRYARKKVLQDVSFEVNAGEFYGIVGMNGSGKSTLIKSLLDLTMIDTGKIFIFGKSHRNVASRDSIAYLPDRFSPPAHLRCKDFIAYMLELHNTQYDEDCILQMFDALELARDVYTASVHNLSKGMTQKLGLASCLLSKKSLLILDEPMSGLDPKSRVLFKQQLQKLKVNGVSLFFSSHVLADVDEIADRMAVLHESKILYTGTSAQFKHRYQCDSLEQAYMKCVTQTTSGRAA